MIEKEGDGKQQGKNEEEKGREKGGTKLNFLEPLIYAKAYTECFICFISINLHGEPLRSAIYFHFIGEKTEAPRVN